MSKISEFYLEIKNLESRFFKAIHEDFILLQSSVPELKSIKFPVWRAYNDEGGFDTYIVEDDILVSFISEDIIYSYDNKDALEKYNNYQNIINFIKLVNSADYETILGTDLDKLSEFLVDEHSCKWI